MKKLLTCAIALIIVLSAIVCVYGESGYTAVSIVAQDGTLTMTPSYAEKGDEVLLTFAPNEGYGLYTLDITDSEGRSVGFTKLGLNSYVFLMPESNISIAATSYETGQHVRVDDVYRPSFIDVKPGAWYETPVYWAVENDIMKGISDTVFGLNSFISREDTIEMFYNALGKPYAPKVSMPFIDIDYNASYIDALNWCYANKIIGGVTPNEFGTGEALTRAMLVTILYRIQGTKMSGGIPFTDVRTTDYFYDPVCYCYKMGYINGITRTLFAPFEECYKEELAAFLYRVYG